MDGLREIRTIFSAEWRRTVTSARGVALLGLYAMFSTLVLLIVGALARQINEQVEKAKEAGVDAEMAARQMSEGRKQLVGFLFRDDPAMLDALTDVPLVVLVVFKTTLFFLPLYIALMGFDQISGEVGPRSIRFLTIRARRSSVLFGKFLGQCLVLLSLVVVIDTAVFLFAKATNDDFTWALFLATLIKFWFAAMVFSLAYLALTTLCSTLFRSPAVSLIFNITLLFAFWLVETIGSGAKGLRIAQQREDVGVWERLALVSPSHYSPDLLHPNLAQFGISGAAYAAFALLFLGLAYAILRVRDL